MQCTYACHTEQGVSFIAVNQEMVASLYQLPSKGQQFQDYLEQCNCGSEQDRSLLASAATNGQGDLSTTITAILHT